MMIKPIEEKGMGDEIRGYRLPVERIHLSMDDILIKWRNGGEVEILKGGHVKYYYICDPNDKKVQKAIRDRFYPKQDYFWRFTNYKDEIKLIDNETIRKSYNHRDKYWENGLSVTDHVGYRILGYKYCYKLKGEVIGTGSDGEPILDIKTLELVSKMMKSYNKSIGQLEKKNTLKLLKKMEWTEQQYLAALHRIEFVDNIEEYIEREVAER